VISLKDYFNFVKKPYERQKIMNKNVVVLVTFSMFQHCIIFMHSLHIT